MSANFLIDVLSQFDINIKYFKITIKNQLNRNYGLFYWFLCFVLLSLVLINTFILIFISDDDINNLKKFGSFGFKLAGKLYRFMMDAATVTVYMLLFIILLNYFFDKLQRILKMSSIYEEIRTKHFDSFLMKSAKSISFYFKLGSILAIIFANLVNICVIYFNWKDLIDYPIGFMIAFLTIQFAVIFGYPLILRQMVIIIFFCRMHCFLFKNCNKSMTRLSKNNLKTSLSFHYKLCESVEELQSFLRPMFVLITSVFRPLFCCFFLFTFKITENNYAILLSDVVAIIFFIFTIILSSMITMIDVEAKRGLQSIIGRTFKLSIKQDVFPVSFQNPSFSYEKFMEI